MVDEHGQPSSGAEEPASPSPAAEATPQIEWSEWHVAYRGHEEAITMTLSSGVSYELAVSATNEAGESPPSEALRGACCPGEPASPVPEAVSSPAQAGNESAQPQSAVRVTQVVP